MSGSDQIERWVSAGYHRPIKKEKAFLYSFAFASNLFVDNIRNI